MPEAEVGGERAAAPLVDVGRSTQEAKIEENSARQAEVAKTTDVAQLGENDASAKASILRHELTTEAGPVEEMALSPSGLEEMPTLEPMAQEETEVKNFPPLNDETNNEEAAAVDIVSLVSRQNVRLDAENERLRDEIRNIQSFCQTQGMPAPPPCQEDTFAKLLLIQQQDPSDRNRELRAEHEHLRSTLGSFCKGLTELADQVSTAMSPAQRTERFGEAVWHGDPPGMPSRTETMIAEDTTAEDCARLEQKQRTLIHEIEELEAQSALPTTEKLSSRK